MQFAHILLRFFLSASLVLTPELASAVSEKAISQDQLSSMEDKITADLIANAIKNGKNENSVDEIQKIEDAAKREAAEQMAAFKKFYDLTSTLEQAFAEPAQPRHFLDTFDLLQQEVVDQRRDEINAKIKQTNDANYELTREKTVLFLKDLGNKSIEQAIAFIGADRVKKAGEMMNLDPVQNFFQIINEARTNIQVAELLDIVPEQDIEHFIDEELPPRRLYFQNLKLHVIEAVEGKETIVAHLEQKEAAGSFGSLYTRNGFFVSKSNDQKAQFQILTSTGELIHRFHRPIKALGFYGSYLVYVDKAEVTNELRFIDLDYFKGAVGNTSLPSFRMPILKPQKLARIDIVDGQLRFNDQLIPKEAFRFVSLMGRVEFNVKVALVDPRTQASAIPQIKELAYAMDLSLSAMDNQTRMMIDSSLGGSEGIKALIEESIKTLETQSQIPQKKQLSPLTEKAVENPEDDLMITFNPTFNSIKQELLAQDRLASVNRAQMVSRLFLSRLHLLMAKVAKPNPMGSPKLLQAMASLAESAIHRRGKFKQVWEDFTHHPIVKYGKYGAGVLAAAALGSTLPEPYAFSIFDALQSGRDVVTGYLEHTDYGKNFVRLMGEAASTALSGIPSASRYFTEEELPKLGILGVAMGGLILSIYGSLHLSANVIGVARYFKRHENWRARAMENGMTRLEAWKLTFIRYQNALRLYYNKGLAAAERKPTDSGNTKSKFTEAENQVIEQLLNPEKTTGFFAKATGLVGGIIGTSVSGVKFVSTKAFGLVRSSIELTQTGWNNLALRFFKKSDESLKNQVESIDSMVKQADETVQTFKHHIHLKEVTTFSEALKQFALSYPSTLITSRFSGGIWNYWFMIRTFALTPSSWPLFAAFPGLFRVGIQGQTGKLHMPSYLNGGYRSRLETWAVKWKDWRNGTNQMDQLKKFEKLMLPIESLAYEIALERALVATIRATNKPEDLQLFFESGLNTAPGAPPSAIMAGAAPSTGIRSISDPKLNRLSSQQRTFFRSVFDQVYGEITQRYVQKVVLPAMDSNEGSTVSSKDIKDAGVQHLTELTEISKQIKSGNGLEVRTQLNRIADEIMTDGALITNAKKISENFEKIGTRYLLNQEHKVISKLDPKNRQIGRFLLAEKQLANVKAVVRAMNSMFTDIVIEKGMGLAIILVMYSALTEGMLAPLQEEMFGPNSWFYGSRYHFLNGFATGVIMSALANVWMKVQLDSRVDEAGGFDKVPMVKDQDRSYFRYYLKTFFKNPTNSWSSNQLHSMRLAWSNLSAAFVTIATINFLTLGRFDLGSFLTGYLIVFLTPLSGIDYKLDQTHELASRWQAGQIIQKLRTHPKMLSWMNAAVRMKRIPHALGTSLYGFFMGPFVSMFELMDTDAFGKRSFLNLLLNGYQPEEIVSKGLQKVEKVAGWVPGVTPALEFCESLLTNNNTALDPSKLMNPPVKGGQ